MSTYFLDRSQPQAVAFSLSGFQVDFDLYLVGLQKCANGFAVESTRSPLAKSTGLAVSTPSFRGSASALALRPSAKDPAPVGIFAVNRGFNQRAHGYCHERLGSSQFHCRRAPLNSTSINFGRAFAVGSNA